MKKFLSLLLALMMVLSSFAAFAEDASEGDSATEAAATETTEVAPEDASAGEAAAEVAGEAAVEEAPAEEAVATEDESTGESAGETAEADPEAEAAAAAELERLNTPLNYVVIPADETTGQKELSYVEGAAGIVEVDGLKFKDLDKDGELDDYEDWRLTDDERIVDLLSKMTAEEKIGGLLTYNVDLQKAASDIVEYHITNLLFNLNGTPDVVATQLNNLQHTAEGTRLGIPMIFSSDREYNAFGGYIDKAHNAFGNANDPELAYELAYYYGTAMNAVGIHVTFEPFANEIGAQYGENPELIAEIVAAEIKGLEDSGFASCVKHWIGRGGDSSFGAARSVAQNFDNWMVGWKAALGAGAEWVMTNCGGTGISNTCDVKFDDVTMNYLRIELGFDGVVVTDWWAFAQLSAGTGVDNQGNVLDEMSYYWLFNRALELGSDLIGTAGGCTTGTMDEWWSNKMTHYPFLLAEGLENGEISEEYVDRSLTRLYRFAMKRDLFDNPYNDPQEALNICASAEYAANPTEIHTNEELRAARNPEEVKLTEELQAKSAVLVKNDNNILPLQQGIKVYLDSSSADRKTAYGNYIANYATLVENIEEADVVVGDFSGIDDAAELLIDDAKYYGKPLVLTMNQSSPTQYALENADAVLYMSYNHQADHGTTEAGFITATEPWVYADLLFGVKEPGGVITKEIARGTDAAQWKDLAGDMGASTYVRLMIQATMMADEEYHASPNNWGDPLVQALYGMKYNEQPEFGYSCLILPQTLKEVEGEDSSGNKTVTSSLVNEAKAGEALTIYCLLNNYGADGITTVQVKANGEVVAEKIYTVCADSWRVVEIEVTLAAGDYTIEVGGMTGTLTVVE